MFTNLIESDSHRQEFKRRSSFFLATVAGYTLILFAAGIAGILAYDARVEAQTSSLELLEWVPPVKQVDADQPRAAQPPRRLRSNVAVDRHLDIPMRTNPVATVNDPLKIPEKVGIVGPPVQPVTGPVKIGSENLNPSGLPPGTGTCVICSGNDAKPRVVVENDTPPPTPTQSKPKALPPNVLIAKAISLPKPVYPRMAIESRLAATVNVQILVDESGKVISAQAVKGHPMFLRAAQEAALRARFTPTMLNDKPVKVQGVITYNFVLQ